MSTAVKLGVWGFGLDRVLYGYASVFLCQVFYRVFIGSL